jgi:hypothetical protein
VRPYATNLDQPTFVTPASLAYTERKERMREIVGGMIDASVIKGP